MPGSGDKTSLVSGGSASAGSVFGKQPVDINTAIKMMTGAKSLLLFMILIFTTKGIYEDL